MSVEAPENLQEGLVSELRRMREVVIPAYESIGNAGKFGLIFIRQDVKEAEEALASGDIVAMAVTYQKIKNAE